MSTNRLAASAALATFGLAALGAVALAAPGNADAGSGRSSGSSSNSIGSSVPPGQYLAPQGTIDYTAINPKPIVSSTPTAATQDMLASVIELNRSLQGAPNSYAAALDAKTRDLSDYKRSLG
jgi:hypothetical protein